MHRYVADVGLGTVRFIGLDAVTQKPRLGIELKDPKGKNNGTSKGVCWSSQHAAMLLHSFDLSSSSACALANLTRSGAAKKPCTVSYTWRVPRLSQ